MTSTEKENYFRSAFVSWANTNPSVFVETIEKIKDDKSGLRFLNISDKVNQWVKQYKDLNINDPKLKKHAAYFDAEVSSWSRIINEENFDIVKFFQNTANDRYFQPFYVNVLGGAYANYSKFIEDWWIVYKSTSESS